MTTLLVVAKAPRPGFVKTRLCPPLTPWQAAALAAAALLDTLDAVRVAARADAERQRPVVALAGDLTGAVGERRLIAALRGCTVIGQHGATFAHRLAAAHLAAAGPEGAVLQIGMDTPQITAPLLGMAADLVAHRPEAVPLAGPRRTDSAPHAHTAPPGGASPAGTAPPTGAAPSAHTGAALGPAEDGGWWALGLRRAGDAGCLAGVPMSTCRTHDDTVAALAGRGLAVAALPRLTDVDTAADAAVVARRAPGTRFGRLAAALLPPAVDRRAAARAEPAGRR